MMSDSFADQYKHPLWQKKRLEILERDGFQCQICGHDSSELHVHHRYYFSNRKVWEYRSWCFMTLCKFCHETIHDKKLNNEQVAELLKIVDERH